MRLVTESYCCFRCCLIFSFSLCYIPVFGASEDVPGTVSLSVDSAFFTPLTPTRAIDRFSYDVNYLSLFLSDTLRSSLDENSVKSSPFWSGLLYYYAMYAGEFALHEFGHKNRDQASGYDSDFIGRSNNIHLFYLDTLLSPGIHTSNWSDDVQRFEVHQDADYLFDYTHGEYADWDIVGSAAGFASDMRFAQLLADKIYDQHGRAIDFLGYTHNRLFPAIYVALWDVVEGNAFGDHTDLSSAYQERGWDIDEQTIAAVSIATYAMSASTYFYAKSLLKNGFNGEAKAKLFNGFRLPDVEPYFERGVSLKLLSGWRFNSLVSVPFSIEKVFLGEVGRSEEYMVGLRVKHPETRMRFLPKVLFGEAWQGSFEVSRKQNNFLEFYGGADHQNVKNLEGMRYIPSLEKGLSYTEFYVGVLLSF